jgi:putative component of toxin-antitoxin plasmid stabilization module
MVSVRLPGGASLLLGGGTKQRQQHDIDQSKEIWKALQR